MSRFADTRSRAAAKSFFGGSPIITALPDFKAYHVVDCGGRETMSISFWENKTEAVRASEAARDWISKSAFGLVPFRPERLQGDTVLDIVAS
jgi:hypothetical protein